MLFLVNLVIRILRYSAEIERGGGWYPLRMDEDRKRGPGIPSMNTPCCACMFWTTRGKAHDVEKLGDWKEGAWKRQFSKARKSRICIWVCGQIFFCSEPHTNDQYKEELTLSPCLHVKPLIAATTAIPNAEGMKEKFPVNALGMGRTWQIFARICLLCGGNLSSRAFA